MSFSLRDHTADVAVEASGESLDAVFGAVADGMAAAMCDEIPAEGGERFEFTVAAEGREALLFDYLDELIYERDVRGVLPVDNEAAVRGPGVRDSDGTDRGAGTDAGDGNAAWHLSGSARGVPLDAVEARDLKAVTYSEMDLSETADGWHAYVVFDV
ncbi:archease [Halosimplex halobium]|uniref:archease n=1 Tax=Halosimplex halobium TaxID=3396618 RepID=UPI003F57E950